MGKALLIILGGFIILYSGFQRNMQDTAKESANDSSMRYSKHQAKYIAEGGTNLMLSQLKNNVNWRGEKTDIPIAGGTADVFAFNRNDLGNNTVEIKSTGTFNGVVDSAGALINIWAVSDRFSRFSYFSNREENIWFYSRDTLYGPVHTNSRFNMTGTPTFYGLVSSVSPTYETMGYTNPRFLGGTNFGRDRINLEPDFGPLQDAANNGGHLVSNYPLYLKFQSDGTYMYKVGNYGSWQTRAIPDNGVIACNRSIYVEGTINGQVTIATTNKIIITNDIIYTDNPMENPESDDLLGLVAYDDIVIQNNSDNRNVCKIQATLLSRDGSFKAEYIDFIPSTRLELYGGIVQEIRGAVGRLGSPPRGFEKRYRYDERMEYMYPPFYPIAPGAVSGSSTKGKIEIIYWK